MANGYGVLYAAGRKWFAHRRRGGCTEARSRHSCGASPPDVPTPVRQTCALAAPGPQPRPPSEEALAWTLTTWRPWSWPGRALDWVMVNLDVLGVELSTRTDAGVVLVQLGQHLTACSAPLPPAWAFAGRGGAAGRPGSAARQHGRC